MASYYKPAGTGSTLQVLFMGVKGDRTVSHGLVPPSSVNVTEDGARFSTYPAEPRVRQCVCGRREVQGQPRQNTNEEMHVAVRLQEDDKLRQSRDN